MTDHEIGSSNLPKEVQQKLGEFVDWLDSKYEIDQGPTTLYWFLDHEIGKRLK